MPLQNNSELCFVLMPFTVRDEDLPKYGDKNHWVEVYEGLILPAVGQVPGLQCERDDIDMGSRAIVEGVFAKIEAAALILCDISAFNPNVLFELGWALRSDKRFVLIKDQATTFHNTIRTRTPIVYNQRLFATTRTPLPRLYARPLTIPSGVTLSCAASTHFSNFLRDSSTAHTAFRTSRWSSATTTTMTLSPPSHGFDTKKTKQIILCEKIVSRAPSDSR
jgi:hypothetical protein